VHRRRRVDAGGQPDDHRRLGVGGGGLMLAQEGLDHRHERRRRGGRRAVDGDDAQRQRAHPARPAVQAAGGALGDLGRVPRPVGDRRGELDGQLRSVKGVVHDEKMIAAPSLDCSSSRVPEGASERMHSRARDALAHVIGDPRGSPGEGDAPAGAPARLEYCDAAGESYRTARAAHAMHPARWVDRGRRTLANRDRDTDRLRALFQGA
jgi:hypothetical protein